MCFVLKSLKIKVCAPYHNTHSGFQWGTTLSSEKTDSVITNLLAVMVIMGIPTQIKTVNASAYVSNKMNFLHIAM